MLHVTDLITGTHTITVTATDSGGHAATEARTITVGAPQSRGLLYLPLVLVGPGG
jgi:hypothetical protein